VRARDGHRCRFCGRGQAESVRQFPVDHVIPVGWFLSQVPQVYMDDSAAVAAANTDQNLVTVCASCHARKTSRAERAWLRGDTHEFRAYLRSLAITTDA